LFLLSPKPPLLRSTAKVGQAVSLTAAITPAVVGKLVPTGTVSFYNGTVLLGTAAPGGTLMTSFSKATFTLTAKYRGDANFTGSTSAPFTLTVQ